MGAQLKKMYDFVSAEKGLQGKMRLAVMTGIASANAETEPDSPDNISKFKSAVKEITGKDAPV